MPGTADNRPDPAPALESPMAGLPHEAILASAGSGKTFQLAHRCIALLAAGVPVDRMAALTFSRKAAGEIFESLVAHLCRAAASGDAAAAVAQRINCPEADQAFFLALLRRVLDQVHRLHIGTLDSFMVGVARAFPMELGLPCDFQVTDADGAEAEALREEALARVLDPRFGDAAARAAFVEAFKQATFGRAEKRFNELVGALVAEGRALVRLLPEEAAWGDPERIWPDGNPLLAPGENPEAAAARARAGLESAGLPAPLREALELLVAFAERFDQAARWDDRVERRSVFKPWMAALRAPPGEGLKLTYRKKEYTLEAGLSDALRELARAVVGVELRRAIEQTRGMYRTLDRFNALYDGLMRSRGHLTFDDVQAVLAGVDGRQGPLLSRSPGPGRLFIDFRLDCRLDHWLLDEFQDTSDLQWAVLRNLADEILQDDSGRRSFFYVGDVKQAIYSWRGGNPGLFGAILHQYGPVIRRRPLDRSFRSCEAVIRTVNRVFDLSEEDGLPDDTLKAWKAVWREHSCAGGIVPATGCAMLLEPPCPPDGEKPGPQDRFALAAGLLRDLSPAARGLSCAVLVRDNAAARALVDYLRRACPGLRVALEGQVSLLDDPGVCLLLALVRLAAHPGDRLAAGHLAMSPLGPALGWKDGRPGTMEELPGRLLGRIQQEGYEAFLRHWAGRLERAAPLEAFGRHRLRGLLAAAARFDAGGPQPPDAFLKSMAAHREREEGESAQVRVMTIHQAKGLGFDVVILPDLMGRGFDRAFAESWLEGRRTERDRPDWILRRPRRTVAEIDPALGPAMTRAAAGIGFEALCVLYVALTRARQGLYLITSYPGAQSEALTAAALIKQRLHGNPKAREGEPLDLDGVPAVCLFSEGDPGWFRALPPAPRECAAEPAVLPSGFAARPSLRPPLERVEPSAALPLNRRAADLFRAETHKVLDFGSAMHELLEQVEWADEVDVEAVIRAWLAESADSQDVRRDVCQQFRRLFESPDVRAELARPEGPVQLWRERSFEDVTDHRWVSGIFDRVTLLLDARGRPRDAVILDYKSNRLRGEERLREAARLYRPQMELYRDVLRKATGLPADRIRLRLLFTVPARVWEIPEDR